MKHFDRIFISISTHYIFHEHFPDATQLERTWGEKKEKKKNMVRDAFSIADSNYAMVIMVITVRISHRLLIPATA